VVVIIEISVQTQGKEDISWGRNSECAHPAPDRFMDGLSGAKKALFDWDLREGK